MNTSDLDNALNTASSTITLGKILSKEVSEYVLLSQKKGASIPIYFNEDKEITISNSSVRKLLSETINGNLSNIHLAYICDCLTLGEKVTFENEEIEDLIFALADPEINGGYKNLEELQNRIDNL